MHRKKTRTTRLLGRRGGRRGSIGGRRGSIGGGHHGSISGGGQEKQKDLSMREAAVIIQRVWRRHNVW